MDSTRNPVFTRILSFFLEKKKLYPFLHQVSIYKLFFSLSIIQSKQHLYPWKLENYDPINKTPGIVIIMFIFHPSAKVKAWRVNIYILWVHCHIQQYIIFMLKANLSVNGQNIWMNKLSNFIWTMKISTLVKTKRE